MMDSIHERWTWNGCILIDSNNAFAIMGIIPRQYRISSQIGRGEHKKL